MTWKFCFRRPLSQKQFKTDLLSTIRVSTTARMVFYANVPSNLSVLREFFFLHIHTIPKTFSISNCSETQFSDIELFQSICRYINTFFLTVVVLLLSLLYFDKNCWNRLLYEITAIVDHSQHSLSPWVVFHSC